LMAPVQRFSTKIDATSSPFERLNESPRRINFS
jgi:hypothetical protein